MVLWAMAQSFVLGFLLLLVAAAATVSLISAGALPPPAQSPYDDQSVMTPPPPLSSSDDDIDKKTHLNKIIDALMGTGDFGGWVNLLSADTSSLPLTATLFIPNNDAVSRSDQLPSSTAYNPFLIPYHIVPQRLTFTDLRQLHVNARLPTMLPSNYVVITNNSLSNFSINYSQITHPDIYVNPSFSVQGIKKNFDYARYDDIALPKSPVLSSSTPPNGQKQEDMGTLRPDDAVAFRAHVFPSFMIICAVISSRFH